MADYWNNVKVVNADISGSAAKAEGNSAPASTSVAQKLWGDDEPTVELGADKEENSVRDFKKRVEELMPTFYQTNGQKVDKDTLEWQGRHRAQKNKIRQTNEYKFAMMIAGAANLKIERIWTTPSEDPKMMQQPANGSTNESGDSFLTPAPNADDYQKKQAFQHQWSQVPEVSMEIHLSPQVYYQVQESLNMVKKHPKARKVTVKGLISRAETRTLFAGLVAINIKFSSFMSGLNYQLDANYKRLKRERQVQMMRIVAAIKKTASRNMFT